MCQRSVSGRLSGVGAKKRCVTVSASHPFPFSSTTRTATLRWSWHVLVYASNCIQTYPPPLHCFVLVYVSNCRVGIAAALFAFGPFMTRPLCSRLNITVAKPTLPYPSLLNITIWQKEVGNKCSSAPSCFMHAVSFKPVDVWK